MKNVVIIGGTAAGPKTAAKLRRLEPDANIIIIEKGDYLSYAGCGMPYYIAGKVPDMKALYSTPYGLARDFDFFKSTKNIMVMNKTEAININKKEKSVEVKDLKNKTIKTIPYDYLVIATGSAPVVPPIEGINLQNVFVLHSLEQAKAIRASLDSSIEKAVIIGGGLIGLEMAEALYVNKEFLLDVSIVEMLPEILPFLDHDMAFLVRKYCETEGITFYTNEKVSKLVGDENGFVKKVITLNNELDADIVIVAAGFRPNVSLAKECGIELGVTGGIKVNNKMQTNDLYIYAAGDCIESQNIISLKPVYSPMGSSANKQGRVVALNIAGENEIYQGIANSVIVKILDFTVAKTGLNLNEAFSSGYDTEYSLVPAHDKPHYYPTFQLVISKLIADKRTGKFLGAQFVGKGDVLKSINIASTALHFNADIKNISNLDIPYAPPYSAPIDNICLGANVLRNKMANKFKSITFFETKKKIDSKEDIVLLDVRETREFETNRIDNSINIPLGQLRENLDKLSKDKLIIVYCQLSLRGYEASIILQSNGFTNVKVLDGGLVLWPYELIRKKL